MGLALVGSGNLCKAAFHFVTSGAIGHHEVLILTIIIHHTCSALYRTWSRSIVILPSAVQRVC